MRLYGTLYGIPIGIESQFIPKIPSQDCGHKDSSRVFMNLFSVQNLFSQVGTLRSKIMKNNYLYRCLFNSASTQNKCIVLKVLKITYQSVL